MTPEMSQEQAPTPSLSEMLAQTPSAGAILAAQRKQLGMSVDEVSAKLKLSHRQIEALETDRYDALPGNTFVRGFVRNYARLLQIDAQPLLHYLESHLPQEAPQAALPRLQSETLPTLRPGGSPGQSSFLLAVLGGLALALIAFGAYWLVQQSRQEPILTLPETQAPVVLETPAPIAQSAPVVSAPAIEAAPAAVPPEPALPAQAAALTPALPAAQPTPAPATAAPTLPPATTPQVTPPAVVPAPTGEIRVVAKQESWVQITDANGRRLVNELLPAGQVRVVGGKPPYQVRIGNGRQTELYYKGKATDLGPYIRVDVANLELN
ncbi:cytoskeleton protein RodZ [Chitinimonas taiwanensis DSM 18899]|uniref:Cytoskeleton protein RodZ n=2 Tax=Chitinimonas TaxID=240411 RepID=A0A1K2H7T8_9NEIS|nr:cytoskeleton protein RodZ [Chitinimonas taiwanensis DSM 18899]